MWPLWCLRNSSQASGKEEKLTLCNTFLTCRSQPNILQISYRYPTNLLQISLNILNISYNILQISYQYLSNIVQRSYSILEEEKIIYHKNISQMVYKYLQISNISRVTWLSLHPWLVGMLSQLLYKPFRFSFIKTMIERMMTVVVMIMMMMFMAMIMMIKIMTMMMMWPLAMLL